MIYCEKKGSEKIQMPEWLCQVTRALIRQLFFSFDDIQIFKILYKVID